MENKNLKNELNSNKKKELLSDLHTFVEYEVRASWWASWISWDWGQYLVAKYFAWKIKKKYERYKNSKI
jgi:hypothetical protein